jgi:uncharacterized alkaline shock family protein YloU
MLLLVFLWIGISYVMQNIIHTSARDYHGAVVRRVEDSNFTPNIISECKKDAKEKGYDLRIDCYGDSEHTDAKIRLSYTYTIPVINEERQYTIEGYAR